MTQSRRRAVYVILLLCSSCLAGLGLAMCDSAGRNSVSVSVGSCLIAGPLGTLLAILLIRTDLPGRRFWLGLFAVLLFVPLYLQTAGWDAGFGRMGWQGGPERADWFSGLRAAIWIHALAAVPWVVLIVAAGLSSGTADFEEAALLTGSSWQVLRHVTLHRVTGAIVLAGVWVLVTAATESVVTDVYALDTFARKLFVATTGLDQGLYAAEVVIGVGTISAFVLLGLALLVRLAASEPSGGLPRPTQFSLGRFRLLGLLFVVCVVLAAVVAPVANLVFQAGEESRLVGTNMIRTWSAERFAETISLTFRRFTNAFRWTAVIAGSAATLACLVGVPLAWLGRRGGIRSLPAGISVLAGLAVPAPLIAELVIWSLNRDSPALLGWLYDRSILAPALTVALRGLPLVIIVMWFAMWSIATDQLDTATIDGAGSVRRLWSIMLPQAATPLAIAWLIAFAIAAGDVTASLLVMPPGIETVAVRVFELLHAGVEEQVAGLCLISATGYAGIGSVIYLLARRWIGGIGAEPKLKTRL